MTLRQVISIIRTALKEYNADTRLSNKAIYNRVITIGSLIMQRESDALRLARLQGIYQTLKCIKIEEAPAIDDCCGIKSLRKVYRTIIELPEMYEDSAGVLIRNVLSVDESSSLELTTSDSVRRALEDTNSKYDKTKYAFYKDKHIYLVDPIQRINVQAFFVHDITYKSLCNCNETPVCYPFLDTEWMIPKKVQNDVVDSVVDSFVNKSLFEKKPDDININKNPNN